MGELLGVLQQEKAILNESRKGQDKFRETLLLKEKLSFGRGQGQVGLYGRTDGWFFSWNRQF